MSAKAQLVAKLAPPAPPCFSSRMQWVTYLQSAAESQKATKLFDDQASQVIVYDERGEPKFNTHFSMCRDCSAQHSHAMLTKGKCKPRHLIDMQPAKTEVAA